MKFAQFHNRSVISQVCL